MRARARTSLEPGPAAAWLLAGALEAPLSSMLLGWPWPLPGWLVLTAHAGAAALLFAAPPRGPGYLHHSRHWGAPLGLLGLFVPGAGWLAAGWLLARHGGATRHREAYVFEDEEAEEANPLAGAGREQAIRREVADARNVIPAIDALMSPDIHLRRGAIEALSRIVTPEAISWLQRARGGADPDSRFYATSALTRIKRQFETSVRAAEEEVYRHPGDMGRQIGHLRIRVQYALSTLLEPEIQRAVLEDCRGALRALAGRNEEALRLLYLVESELDPAAALGLLDRIRERAGSDSLFHAKEKARLLFESGRYAEVRALLRDWRRSPQGRAADPALDPAWWSVVSWWVNDDAD